MTLLHGEFGPAEIALAASLTVRYGDVPGKGESELIVDRKGGVPYCVTASGAREEDYVPLRIALS